MLEQLPPGGRGSAVDWGVVSLAPLPPQYFCNHTFTPLPCLLKIDALAGLGSFKQHLRSSLKFGYVEQTGFWHLK